ERAKLRDDQEEAARDRRLLPVLGQIPSQRFVELSAVAADGVGDRHEYAEQAQAQQEADGEMEAEILFPGKPPRNKAAPDMPNHGCRPRCPIGVCPLPPSVTWQRPSVPV